MLEKRVKSRFSHRIIRVSPPTTLDSYMSLVYSTMALPEGREISRIQSTPRKKGKLVAGGAEYDTWRARWKDAVDVSRASTYFHIENALMNLNIASTL